MTSVSALEKFLYENRIPDTRKSFEEHIPFFYPLFCNINQQDFDLLPFQDPKELEEIDTKHLWKKFYKNVDYIASYYYTTDGKTTNNNVQVKGIPFYNDNYIFHLLCKLKNGFWLYIYMCEYITEFETGLSLPRKMYAHKNVDILVKYGIPTKYYDWLNIPHKLA